jgi:hypothetical protein
MPKMLKPVILQIKGLIDLVKENRAILEPYFPTPDRLDCLRFAATEAAEALDAEMRQNLGYARNHEKHSTVTEELADCAMMLASALPSSRSPETAHNVNLETWSGVEQLVAVISYQAWDQCRSREKPWLAPTDMELWGTIFYISTHPDIKTVDALTQLVKARMERIKEKHLPHLRFQLPVVG